jgi:4-hydroxy-tetrahydrodipicolinate synthase
VLSTYDEGPDLVLFYKYLLVLNGETEYELHFNVTDALSASQKNFVEQQYSLFKKWWANWPGKN